MAGQDMTVRQTIVQLLSNMSGSREARIYLQRFSGLEAERFAVIKIGGAILAEELEATAAALAFLHQVGLTPVVIHGGGPQLDQAMQAQGLTCQKRDGLRVTTPQVLDVARQVFLEQNLKLVEAVRAQGVDAHTLTAGVIEAEYKDREKYGFVGVAKSVQQDLIRSVIGSGAIPILTCLGVAAGGQIVNINGDAVVAALVQALQPMKIIFLTGVGGLLDGEGQVIESINLTTDYNKLMEAEWVHSGMRVKLAEINRLLDTLSLDSSVSITRPQELVRELFTHGGSGTNVRRGEGIVVCHDKSGVDGLRLKGLVEESFGRDLRAGWWEGFDLHRAVISQAYRAGAVVRQLPGTQMAYLDKFAVVESARGEGLARAIWQELTAQVPLFFLRSRAANGFNDFYRAHTDGSVRRGDWTVFWKGDISLSEAAPIVDEMLALSDSFA